MIIINTDNNKINYMQTYKNKSILQRQVNL